MFQAVIQRAQRAVDKTIDHAINRTVMVVPFIIAAGFGTAALAFRLNHEFGPEIGNLMMGGLFGVVGLITMALMKTRPEQAVAEEEKQPLAEAKTEEEAAQADTPGLDGVDRDVLISALTSLGPMALPELLRLLLKNLPLVAVLAGAIFVATRSIDETGPADGPSGSVPA
jgi:hypothetical protein